MEINLTRNLRAAMANAKIDQKHLAEASGCSRAAVSQYLSGKYMPGKDALQRLAAALNVTVDWLFAISIHAPREGSDLSALLRRFGLSNFNPRSP